LNHRKVLLVDDEQALREAIAAALGAAGFLVAEANNGFEALQLAKSSGPFDIVVSDVVMPRLGGSELVAQLATENPMLKVVLMSGTAPPPGFAGVFLPKPFSMRTLIQVLIEL
jgi:two-component system, cell cycle sensor histidine kinase and response regulator CckA